MRRLPLCRLSRYRMPWYSRVHVYWYGNSVVTWLSPCARTLHCARGVVVVSGCCGCCTWPCRSKSPLTANTVQEVHPLLFQLAGCGGELGKSTSSVNNHEVAGLGRPVVPTTLRVRAGWSRVVEGVSSHAGARLPRARPSLKHVGSQEQQHLSAAPAAPAGL